MSNKQVSNEVESSVRPRPFLKWAGGKSRVSTQLVEYFPSDILHRNYYEPFLGGGAMYFKIAPKKGRLNDLNFRLIGTYNVIKKHVEPLIKILLVLQDQYDSLPDIENKLSMYIQLREEFNNKPTNKIRDAALFIFLNKTGFNGMYRENKSGGYNIPFGKHNSVRICDADNLRLVSKNIQDIDITCSTYEDAIMDAKKGDFIYLDPPYIPLSATSSFTQYQADGFTDDDQVKLRDMVVKLSKRGCYIMQSNSTAPRVYELYKGFRIDTIKVGRTINSNKSKRGKIEETVITNYYPGTDTFYEEQI